MLSFLKPKIRKHIEYWTETHSRFSIGKGRYYCQELKPSIMILDSVMHDWNWPYAVYLQLILDISLYLKEDALNFEIKAYHFTFCLRSAYLFSLLSLLGRLMYLNVINLYIWINLKPYKLKLLLVSASIYPVVD